MAIQIKMNETHIFDPKSVAKMLMNLPNKLFVYKPTFLRKLYD